MDISPAHQPTITKEPLLRAWLRSVGLFRRTMEPYFATFGITGAQWGVLNTLHHAEAEGVRDVRMSDLGERLLIRPPSVTTVVQRSKEMGLLAGRPSSKDHRVKCVVLTAAGRAMVKRVKTQHESQIRGVFGCLNEDEQSQLATLLGKLSTHLSDGLASDRALNQGKANQQEA